MEVPEPQPVELLRVRGRKRTEVSFDPGMRGLYATDATVGPYSGNFPEGMYLRDGTGDILGTPRRRSLNRVLPHRSSRMTNGVQRSVSTSDAIATGQNWP